MNLYLLAGLASALLVLGIYALVVMYKNKQEDED